MSDVPGIYASNTALLDFGIVRKSDHRKKLPLEIMNSGKSARAVEINWIRQVPVKGRNESKSESQMKRQSVFMS